MLHAPSDDAFEEGNFDGRRLDHRSLVGLRAQLFVDGGTGRPYRRAWPEMLDGPETGPRSRHDVDALLEVTENRDPYGDSLFDRRHENVGVRQDHLHEVGPLGLLAADLSAGSLARSGIERCENGAGCL